MSLDLDYLGKCTQKFITRTGGFIDVITYAPDGVTVLKTTTFSNTPTPPSASVLQATAARDLLAQVDGAAGLTQAQVAAGSTGVVGVSSSGALTKLDGTSLTVSGGGRVAVTNRCGFPNLKVDNVGTAGTDGRASSSYGNCGILTAPRSTAGSGMPAGTYTTTLSGGTPVAAGSVTYTVDSTGSAVSVTINPGRGYNTAPTCTATAAGAGGGPSTGTVPTFGTLTIGASANEYFAQSDYTVAEDCWDLELHFGNFIANAASPGQTDNGPSTLTRRMGLRVNGVAAALPLYSPNGSRDIVIEPGADLWLTAPGPYYKGQTIWLQDLGVYKTPPAQWPVSTIAIQGSGSAVCEFGTNLTDNSLATTAVSGLVHASVYAINPPISIIGRRRSTVTSPVIALFGDSIASTGSNDSGTASGLVGFVQRALAGNYGFLNVGASGYGLNAFMASTAAVRIARYRKYKALQRAGVTIAFTNWITNDISGAASDPTSTYITNLLAFRDELQLFGIKLIPMTCCPRTNTANNAVSPADTANGWVYRRNVNAAIAANFSTFYDLGGFMQDPVSTDLWNLTRNPGTHDEIHPTQAEHVLCADVNTAGSFAAALPELLA